MRYYAYHALPDVKELFIETTLDLLLSLYTHLVSENVARTLIHPEKCSLTTVVLIRALVPKTITAPQAKRLVQLGISYQTLQDIRRPSSTDTDFGKALADRGIRSRRVKHAVVIRPEIETFHATPPFVFLFLLPASFCKRTTYPKEITRRAIGVGIRHLHTCRCIAAG